MINQYIRLAFRNMRKHKTQSFSGIFALFFGLICFVPALYWLRYETSYDTFYPENELIYRIYTTEKETGKTNDLASGILERRLREQYPAMKNTAVFFTVTEDFSTPQIPHTKLKSIYTDSAFLNVFQQQILRGDIHHPLEATNNLILTESKAISIFGSAQQAIGKSLKKSHFIHQEAEPYIVTAVVADPPENTNIPFEAIICDEQINLHKSFPEESGNEIWDFAQLHMYARIPAQSNATHLFEQLRTFPKNTYANSNIEVKMMPITEVRHHLNPDVAFTLNFIRLFIAAGILLLFSAIFNFINLYLELFRQRDREFRLRSVNGASQKQLIHQMQTELFFAIILALLPGLVFILTAQSRIESITGIHTGTYEFIKLYCISAIAVILIILIGAYMQFARLSYLASRPQKNKISGRSILLMNTAVTLQLTVSIIIIIASLIVTMQMHYMKHKNLGFNQNGIIHLSGLNPFIEDNKRTAIIHELSSLPQVRAVTDTDFEPQHHVNPFKMTTNVEWAGKPETKKPAFNYISTDPHFAKAFGIQMQAGEWLTENSGNDIVVNEEAVRVMGLDNPVGTLIRIKLNEDKQYRITGVVKDFHTLSLRNSILPAIFLKSEYPTNSFYVHVSPEDEQKTIQQINGILPKIDPAFTDVTPLPLHILYDRLNHSEDSGLKLFSILACICIIISLTGVYAVATTGTQHRRKEIAIRKVVGANVKEIIYLFFREYTLQVLTAAAVALPVAYTAMSYWLEGYAYRTNISWWLLIGTVISIIAAVLLTVFKQVMNAANSNPANVVKSE